MGLFPVVMQHVRYVVLISASSQLHVMCNREAGGLELAVLDGGVVLGVLLGGVARLGCSCGLVSH